MVFLDEHFAVKPDGSAFQLIEFKTVHDVKKMAKSTTYRNMEALNAGYLEAKADAAHKYKNFQTSRVAMLEAIANLRRSLSDVVALADLARGAYPNKGER